MFYDTSIYEYGEASENVTIIDDTNTPKLVYISDVVIGHSSSTLLIPIVLKKLLIIMKWPSCSFVNDRFSNYGITKVSESESDLPLLMRDYKEILKSDELIINRKKYIEDFIQFEDNKSMSRIVNELLN